ncbi:MAG: DUF3784 domain-containing protein [Defluviitaleaceae bacterium]|nr:DUF3784 domain-containing protein [Defluviitaleaceae bacterium]
MIFLWIMVALLVIMSIPLLMGKGAWMISGYNTMSPKEKELYDEKALCRFVGLTVLAMAAGLALMGVGDIINIPVLFQIGIAIAIIVGIGSAAYVGLSFKRFLKKGVTVGELHAAKVSQKTSKAAIILGIVITVTALIGTGAIFYFGEREPVITVHADSLHIDGMYGTTVPFDRITSVTLVEDSMSNIGMGIRRGGYAGFTGIRKGRFDAGLLIVDSRQSPTLQIERTGSRDANIFISFSDPDATHALYQELRAGLE